MLVIAVAVLLKKFYDPLSSNFLVIGSNLSRLFDYVANRDLFGIITLISFLIVIFYILYKFYTIITNKISQHQQKKEKLQSEKSYVEDFLRIRSKLLEMDKLKSKIEEVSNRNFVGKYPELNLKIIEMKKLLVELQHEDELKLISREKMFLEREIEELAHEKERLKRSKEAKLRIIRNNLNIDENKVFERYKLSEIEVKILLKEGYKQINEYCVYKQKIIPVLVKSVLNHSATHTFLVWSTQKLLKKYNEITNVIEHETRDADLTFNLNGKKFAIEIETGTLLRKKKQLLEKIKFLDKTYSDRWMIIVSNRNLIKKYNKFGNCTQRKQVCEKLEKMLKI